MRHNSVQRICAAAIVVTAMLVLDTSASAGKATFITFDPPNSHFTEPAAINAFGDVAGSSEDNTGKPLGFVRFGVDGSFAVIEFDGQTQSVVRGINDDQVVTGDWSDSNSNHHCFVGVPLHKFHSCDPKDAQQAFGQAVNNQTHNGTAVVAGDYSDGQERQHAFIWENGTATEFDVPGSISTGAPMAINDNGTIVGTWLSALGPGTQGVHGFLRKHNGSISTFDVPGCSQTLPNAINAAGAIVGLCGDANGFHSFVINSDGSSKIFDPPGAASSEALSINSKGAVIGTWTDQFDEEHGYIRSAGGKCCTTIDVPKGVDTNSVGINDSGLATGYFFRKGLAHGFIRQPAKS